jgi:hypothetical protein
VALLSASSFHMRGCLEFIYNDAYVQLNVVQIVSLIKTPPHICWKQSVTGNRKYWVSCALVQCLLVHGRSSAAGRGSNCRSVSSTLRRALFLLLLSQHHCRLDPVVLRHPPGRTTRQACLTGKWEAENWGRAALSTSHAVAQQTGWEKTYCLSIPSIHRLDPQPCRDRNTRRESPPLRSRA